jgi:hypothetical protein
MNTDCSSACLCLLPDEQIELCDVNDPVNCECNDKLIKCNNYGFCENLETRELLDYHNGLCVYCHIMNGKLNIEENNSDEPCSFCLVKNTVKINFPKKCKHYICKPCYKKKYLFDNDDKRSIIFEVCSICS